MVTSTFLTDATTTVTVDWASANPVAFTISAYGAGRQIVEAKFATVIRSALDVRSPTHRSGEVMSAAGIRPPLVSVTVPTNEPRKS